MAGSDVMEGSGRDLSEIRLSCSVDLNYVEHSAAMLHSILINATGRVRIHYLHDPSLPEATHEALEEMVVGHGGSIDFHPIDPDAVEGLPTVGHLTKAAWYRVL